MGENSTGIFPAIFSILQLNFHTSLQKCHLFLLKYSHIPAEFPPCSCRVFTHFLFFLQNFFRCKNLAIQQYTQVQKQGLKILLNPIYAQINCTTFLLARLSRYTYISEVYVSALSLPSLPPPKSRRQHVKKQAQLTATKLPQSFSYPALSGLGRKRAICNFV